MDERTTHGRRLTDKVNHPAHYGGADNPYEVIKIIEALDLGFHLGSAFKYIARAGKKPGESAEEDLAKAQWYIARKLSLIRQQRSESAHITGTLEQQRAELEERAARMRSGES